MAQQDSWDAGSWLLALGGVAVGAGFFAVGGYALGKSACDSRVHRILNDVATDKTFLGDLVKNADTQDPAALAEGSRKALWEVRDRLEGRAEQRQQQALRRARELAREQEIASIYRGLNEAGRGLQKAGREALKPLNALLDDSVPARA